MSVYLHLNFWNWFSHEVKWIFKTETVFSTQVGSQIAWIVSMGVALLSLSLGSCTLAKIPNPHLRVEFREKTETEEQIEELQEVSPMLTEWALTTSTLGLSVWTLPVSLTDSFVRRALFSLNTKQHSQETVTADLAVLVNTNPPRALGWVI